MAALERSCRTKRASASAVSAWQIDDAVELALIAGASGVKVTRHWRGRPPTLMLQLSAPRAEDGESAVYEGMPFAREPWGRES